MWIRLGTAPTLEKSREQIERYYSDQSVSLDHATNGTYHIRNNHSGFHISGVRVTLVKGRYRFESFKE